jgi:tRNA G37 N-methylase TrmD
MSNQLNTRSNHKILRANKSPEKCGKIYYLGMIVKGKNYINPLNTEVNPICSLLTLGAHHFLHVSRIRVKQEINSTQNMRNTLLSL